MSFGSQPGDPLSWADATGNVGASDAVNASTGSDPTPAPAPATPDTPDPSTPAICSPDDPGCACTNAQITSETVMTEPPDRTRTDIGVGERVTLTYSLGDATWTKSSVQGGLSSDSGASIVFRAPSTPQTVTITATGSGCSATKVFTIIKPIEARMIAKDTLHNANTTTIGMHTDIYLAPFNVNFHWVEDMEDEVMAHADGVYACNDNTGHGPKTTPSTYTTHVRRGYGTHGDDQDTVTSGYCNGGTTQGDGTERLRIPNRWRVRGTNDWYNYLPANQACTSTAAGDLTASKAGAVARSTFATAGSNYPPD